MEAQRRAIETEEQKRAKEDAKQARVWLGSKPPAPSSFLRTRIRSPRPDAVALLTSLF